MIPIEQVYEPDRWGWSDYNPMLASFGYEILVQVDENDYQGDSYLLFYDAVTKRYGWLIFGWGSCSGCDSLQACDTLAEVDELRQSLHEGIEWHDSVESILKRLQEKDWELEWSWHRSEREQWIKEATETLQARIEQA